MKRILLSCLAAASVTVAARAQDPADQKNDQSACPMHEQHQAATAHDHAKHELDKRGDEGMGFKQERTTHHFLLSKTGGAIQVTANSATDKESLAQVQMHLRHIAEAFQSGDFNIPMFVHDQTPPGVVVMQKLKRAISYRYEEMENGGRVVISSGNSEAIAAIHDFLRFQIKEHETGDPLELK